MIINQTDIICVFLIFVIARITLIFAIIIMISCYNLV